MKPHLQNASLLAILLTSGTASAGLLVTGVTTSTNMGSGFGTLLQNTVNGAGLVGGVPSLTAQHLSTIPTNSWVSTAGVLVGNVNFAFPSSQLIDGFSFWNQNNGGPGALGSTGIRGVTVTSSLDGINFFPVVGAPTSFLQIMSNGPVAPQTFSFPPISASQVRFTIRSNYGDTAQTGFAEAQFSAIPEPATALFGLALLGVCATGRRRPFTSWR